MHLGNSPAGSMDIVTLSEDSAQLFAVFKRRESELYVCLKDLQTRLRGGAPAGRDKDLDSDSESDEEQVAS